MSPLRLEEITSPASPRWSARSMRRRDLRDGQRVTMDGSAGVVIVHEVW